MMGRRKLGTKPMAIRLLPLERKLFGDAAELAHARTVQSWCIGVLWESACKAIKAAGLPVPGPFTVHLRDHTRAKQGKAGQTRAKQAKGGKE